MPGDAGNSARDAAAASFRYKHLVTRDADQHAENLGARDQTYDQLTPGRFEGRLTDTWLGDIQIAREVTNQVIYQAGKSWAGGRTFGIVLDMEGDGAFCDRPLPRNGAMVLGPTGYFSLRTPQRLDIVGIALSKELYGAYREAVRKTAPSSLADEGGLVFESSRSIDLLRELLRAFFAAADGDCPPFRQQEAQRCFLCSLLSALSGSVERGVEGTGQPDSHRARRQIVERAKAHVLAHLDTPVTVADLCSVLGLSRRNLQYCFHAVLGLSPVQYLRAVRLNGVRRELRRGGADLRIGDVAARWGFWHQSQFSADYRNLFGELPSQTLRAHS